jgi:hypothetical protein
MFGRALAALVVAAAALTAASSAQAATTQCKGRVVTGVVTGKLPVPDGWRCDLDFAEVLGTVNVEDGATLVASDSRIRGSLVCHRCARMSVNFMLGVGGDVRIRGMTGGAVNFDGVPVGGRFQARDNAAEFTIIDTFAVGRFSFSSNIGSAGFWFSGSRTTTAKFLDNRGDVFQLFAVRGRNVIFSRNTGVSDISESWADKRLQCFDNDPPPVGLLNSAGIAVEGQCAGLVGDGD